MLYYYDKKGTKIGPIHIESLKKFAETKKINPETIITNEKGKEWTAREMPELKFNELEFFTIKVLRKMARTKKRRYYSENDNSGDSIIKKNNIETPINEKNYTVTNKISEQIQKTKHELLNNNNNNNNNTKFLFIHRTKTICYFLSNFFLYGGIIGTLISFLVLLQYTNYSYLILVAGIITSLLLWHVTGLYSDLLEWKINIADDFKQIKKAAPFKNE